MPRQSGVNAKRQPIPPLKLEEFKFWMRILEEHAMFIKMGLPCESSGLINEADTFQQELAAMNSQAESSGSEHNFIELVEEAKGIVEDFYMFNRRLVHLSLTCQLAGGNFALFLDHLSREAEYVMRLLDKISDGQMPLYQVSSAREIMFWLRLLADHSEFVSHKLDPSERNLVDTASGFAEEFDELYLQGRDFVSMLRGESEEVPSFRRFMRDTKVSATRFRDFNKASEMMISECKLVGLIPALMADHLRREADHFLLTLALLEKAPYVAARDDEDLELSHFQEKCTTQGQFATEFIPSVQQVHTFLKQEEEKEEDEKDEEDEEDEEDDGECMEQQPDEPKLVMPEKDPEEIEPPKVKWSGKWPRPLGAKPR